MRAAVTLLSEMGVSVKESIVISELCEWKGRENLRDMRVTSLVRTESVDAVAQVGVG